MRNKSTGFTTSTVTNAHGEYLFKELPPGGPCTVCATFISFVDQSRTGYTLNQSDAVRLNLSMEENDLSPLSRGTNLSGQLDSSTNFTIDGTTAKNPTSAGPMGIDTPSDDPFRIQPGVRYGF